MPPRSCRRPSAATALDALGRTPVGGRPKLSLTRSPGRVEPPPRRAMREHGPCSPVRSKSCLSRRRCCCRCRSSSIPNFARVRRAALRARAGGRVRPDRQSAVGDLRRPKRCSSSRRSTTPNDLPLLIGGPVEPQRGWILTAQPPDGVEHRGVGAGLYLSASPRAAAARAHGAPAAATHARARRLRGLGTRASSTASSPSRPGSSCPSSSI